MLVIKFQEQQDEQLSSPETPASSRRRGRRWETFTDSEQETAPRSIDLQSHDPRPGSVVMAGWGQELNAPTAPIADTEQPVLRRPLLLTSQEKITEVGQAIDSSLPFNYNVNPTHQDQQFRTPREQLPAWKNREEFIKKLGGSRLLIVKAPTGSGHVLFLRDLVAFGALKSGEPQHRVSVQALRKCGESMKTIRLLDSNWFGEIFPAELQ